MLGLGVIMFSGKYKEHLNKDLVSSIDLLIEGPYIESQKDESRILLGSINKKLTFVTDRYSKYEDYFYNPVSLEEVTYEERIRFNSEVELLRSVTCDYIIRYYDSWYDEKKNRIVIITQYMPSGTILEYLSYYVDI